MGGVPLRIAFGLAVVVAQTVNGVIAPCPMPTSDARSLKV
jgi:hypothetical protein